MKQCPVCKTTYTDNSLSFCLNDGATLTGAPSLSSEVTQQMTFGSAPTVEINPPIRVNLEPNASAPFTVPQIASETPPKSGSPFLILTIIGLLAIVAVGGLAGAYFVFFRNVNQPIANLSPTPAASPTQTSVQNKTPDDTRALKDELEKLKKQVNEQKNKKTDSPVSSPAQQPAGTATARVNSPGDGFLSLRTEPSVKSGVQLVKIPTGAIVQLEDCQRDYMVIDTKRGRWCMITYNGQTGWAFDAWLLY